MAYSTDFVFVNAFVFAFVVVTEENKYERQWSGKSGTYPNSDGNCSDRNMMGSLI